MQVSAREDFSTAREMAIPMPWGGALVNAVKILALVGLFMLAVAGVIHEVAPIASCLWIAIVIMILWNGSREEGGLRRFLVNWLGDVARRHFAEVAADNGQPGEVRFGYRLLGHRFITTSIPIDKIETVEWSSRRTTDPAAADRHDWHVRVWFDRGVATKGEKDKWARKPEQEICIVGPFAAKAKTEALGLQLVSLLRRAGASLMETDEPTRYVRPDCSR